MAGRDKSELWQGELGAIVKGMRTWYSRFTRDTFTEARYNFCRSDSTEWLASDLWVIDKAYKVALRIVRELTPACTACNGTGVYVGAKWSRECFRCKGQGVIDDKRRLNNSVYDAVRGKAQQLRSYKDYSNQDFNAVAL